MMPLATEVRIPRSRAGRTIRWRRPRRPRRASNVVRVRRRKGERKEVMYPIAGRVSVSVHEGKKNRRVGKMCSQNQGRPRGSFKFRLVRLTSRSMLHPSHIHFHYLGLPSCSCLAINVNASRKLLCRPPLKACSALLYYSVRPSQPLIELSTKSLASTSAFESSSVGG